MDAPEEDLDIKLQKLSGDLIGEFDRSLPLFLRKLDGAGGSRVRSRVRHREVSRLIASLLDPFQDLPQLLDPHLAKWVTMLSEAYLEYLQMRRRSKPLSTRSKLLMPLPTAICKLIYTFCKIRGEKVIVHFLNVEAKYLELLLSALEESEARTEADASSVDWTWEERYIVLLWLSHLLFAPFDLSTISSVDADDLEIPPINGFSWPANVPGIVIRLLPLAIKYISVPGKERDAAKALLVRMATRRDMQALGILHALVSWSLSYLRPKKDAPPMTPYHYIGVLSFLSGVLGSSSDTSDMDKYLSDIFWSTHAIASNEVPALTSVVSTTPARKAIIKVIRTITVQALRRPNQDPAGTELVETSIGFLLESLADNDTPVRFAASKALSIVTLKLDADMASQVVEAVLDSLNRNVLLVKNPRNPAAPPMRDLTSVDALEWHGLMLTLSHLLYRRSPPAENLADIVHALLMGLSFERRNASGGSMGTNVRDAACFGIWALARRYSTAELLAVSSKPVLAAASRGATAEVSILQVLATELVVTASLDPAGNIRRGSSAALQELIGRHPDTVEKGIWVVQTVDYHAVALRSRAILEVSLKTTHLSSQYGAAILEALLGWRGIGDSDAAARRVAASSFGAITMELASLVEGEDGLSRLKSSVVTLLDHIKALQVRQVEERHGLLLSLAAVLDLFPALVRRQSSGEATASVEATKQIVARLLARLEEILTDASTTTYRRPELVAEATSRLLVSSFPILQAALLGVGDGDWDESKASLMPGPCLVSGTTAQEFSDIVASLDESRKLKPSALQAPLELFYTNLDEWLARPDQEAIAAAAEAALVALALSEVEGRQKIINRWAGTVRHRPTSRAGSGHGYFFALAMAQRIVSASGAGAARDNLISDAILERWASDRDVDTHVAILQSLGQGYGLQDNASVFLPIIAEGLDDYTTNARGDVGSHVRLQAIRMTKALWTSMHMSQGIAEKSEAFVSRLFPQILRLSAEKLDRVRVEAQAALAVALQPSYSSRPGASTFSSKEHFSFLLNLLTVDCLQPSVSAIAKSDSDKWMEKLLSGLCTSADTGNEDLVIASRAALSEYCYTSQDNLERVCTALLRNLKSRQGQDRVTVPTLEVIAFLFFAGLFPRCKSVDYKNLCLQVHKAGYKTGNVRKLEACVKVYGAIAAMGGNRPGSSLASAELEKRRQEGVAEGRRRLGALLLHPWPRIRSVVVDELWGLLSLGGGERGNGATERLKGVDWGKAEKGAIKTLVAEVGLD